MPRNKATTTESKSRPLLMRPELVRATLDESKTQTRRVVPERPPSAEAVHRLAGTHYGWMNCADMGQPDDWRVVGPVWAVRKLGGPTMIRCPYGRVGDRLWIRETFWQQNDTCDHEYCSGCDMGPLDLEFEQAVDYVATPRCLNPPELEHEQTVELWTDDPVPGDWWLSPPLNWNGLDDEDHKRRGVWIFHPWQYFTKRPSIFLPRWGSRIEVELVSIRLEPLQQISEADAIAEGMRFDGRWWQGGPHPKKATPKCYPTAANAFRDVWDQLNKERGYPWKLDPWVWVLEYRKVTM